jgi:hypothetical protein
VFIGDIKSGVMVLSEGFPKPFYHPAALNGFTPRRNARQGRKEGQSEGALSPLRSLRALRLGVKPCRKPAGKFKRTNTRHRIVSTFIVNH